MIESLQSGRELHVHAVLDEVAQYRSQHTVAERARRDDHAIRGVLVDRGRQVVVVADPSDPGPVVGRVVRSDIAHDSISELRLVFDEFEQLDCCVVAADQEDSTAVRAVATPRFDPGVETRRGQQPARGKSQCRSA